MASPVSSSSMALVVVGVVIVTADRLPAALTSTNLMVSSTRSGCLSKSSWISGICRVDLLLVLPPDYRSDALLANFGLPAKAHPYPT